MSLQNYGRAERKVQVKMTLALRIQRGQGNEITMYQVARALGMKPSMHVTRILAEMCAEKSLTCRKVTGRAGRWDTYVYQLSEREMNGFAPKKREVAIKTKGAAVGQLELF